MNTTQRSLFDGAPIISAYTVADAVADGLFHPAPDQIRREAGYRCPVIFTQEAWAYAIQWDDDDPRLQDETGRLWDVLMMMRRAAQQAIRAVGERAQFKFVAVPRLAGDGLPSQEEDPIGHALEVVVQGYDMDGTPCLTILTPGQD